MLARKRTTSTGALALTLTAACHSGHMPAAASVEDHERAAVGNEEIAAAHDRAAADPEPCADAPDVYEICWTRTDTPAHHKDMAGRHRQLARAHRDAANALKEAEARKCVGITTDDRSTSPFSHDPDISDVELLDPAKAEDETRIPVVRVTFGKVGGLSVDTMRRLVDCHIARNAALGHEVPGMEACPLVPPGVKARVDKAPTGVVVTIWADQAHAGEVRERAERLVARHVRDRRADR